MKRSHRGKKKFANICPPGSLQRDALLIGFGVLALGTTRSPVRYYKILGQIKDGLSTQRRDRDARRAMEGLERDRFVTRDRRVGVGETNYRLTSKGERAIAYLHLQQAHKHPSKKWDGKWRLVMFDIPEHMKQYRDALRYHVRRLGLVEYQYSVFITPYDCQAEIEFILEYYKLDRYVRFITAIDIGDDSDIRTEFGLEPV